MNQNTVFRLMLLSGIIAITFLACTDEPQSQLPADPFAEYLFNGNAADTSGNGHDGTVYSATLVADRFGESECAYSLNGVSDYISVPFSVDPNTSGFSFHFFLMVDAGGTDFEFCHLGNGGGEIGGSYLGATGGTISLGVNLTDGWHGPTPQAITVGHWYSISGVYTKGGTFEMFIDGKLTSELNLPDHPMFAPFQVQSALGCVDFDGFGGRLRYWHGKIDDVRFYNRALTEEEINGLFHDGNWPGS